MIQFGRYELLERISLGGMAEVFKARVEGAAGFQKILAVKRILPQLLDDLELEQMFINEAKLSANLNHSNIGQIYDFGEINGQYYIAMEYVQGCDLRAIQQFFRSKSKVMSLPMALRIGLDVCSALDYAHTRIDAGGNQHHIVHRDVSPPNILVSFDGAVKLIDFGIAKALNHSRQTATGFLKGKLGYLSPEQAEGRDIDYRSDIFSLGTVLFEMATGVRLFDEDTDMATLNKVRHAEVPPPSRVNGALPHSIDGVLLKALARRPEQRYQRAEAFYEALEAYAHAERQTLSNIQLSRWMLDAFGSQEALSTLVTSPPSGIARLQPEPALGWDEETGSLPTFPEAPSVPTEPRREKTPQRAPAAEEAADVPTAATRLSSESARLAAQLAAEPKAVTRPGVGAPPSEVVLYVPPAHVEEPTLPPLQGRSGPAASPPPEELTSSTLKPLFQEMAEVAAAVGRPAPTDDEGWDNLKTTPLGWRGQNPEPSTPAPAPEVVVTWQPPAEEPARPASPRPETRDLNQTLQSLAALDSDPDLDPTDPEMRTSRPARAPAVAPAESVDPMATTMPEPASFEARGRLERADPSRSDPTRPSRPAAMQSPAPRRTAAPPFNSGSWKHEPTLTDEPEASQPAAVLTADLPPHAEASLAAVPSAADPPEAAPDSPPRPAEERPDATEPADLALIGALAAIEAEAGQGELPPLDPHDPTESMPAMPELAEPLPEPAVSQPRRRRWWLLWLALAMFVLGMGGTLLAILFRR